MISIPILISAFFIGFGGSFHCVGMCGPLAMSIPGHANQNRLVSPLLYFAGKTLTYGVMGALFGFFGRQFMIAGFQQTLSVILGIGLLVVLAFLYFSPKSYHHNFFTRLLGQWLSPAFGMALKQNRLLSPFLFGLLNGLLPCGLVYLGIIGAVATGTTLGGAVFMLVFGLGTMPVMLAFLLMAHQFSFSFRNRIKKLVPVFIGIMAILLIVRGLGLGIPYLSPITGALPAAGLSDSTIICHP